MTSSQPGVRRSRTAAPGARRLSRRVLNRTLLDRQLLLARADLPVVTAVERVFGLNAQNPNPPYLALWSRLSGYAMEDLTAAIQGRTLVRSCLLRATQHLLSVPDFRLVRPAVAPLLRRAQRNAFGARTAGVDLVELADEARRLLAGGRVLTRPELGRLLARRWPTHAPSALGWSVQYLLPVVHPAPSGTWNVRGATPFVDAGWTGVAAQATPADLRELVRRYLAAFGPATAADARAWSGIPGLREVFAQLRPELQTYLDPAGPELFDLPEAPVAEEDRPAPVRLLPEFDAILLGYADRTRIMTDEIRRQVCDGDAVAATVLVDGTVAASWAVTRADGAVTLTVRPFRRLTAADQDAVHAEAERLLGFAYPDATVRSVQIP